MLAEKLLGGPPPYVSGSVSAPTGVLRGHGHYRVIERSLTPFGQADREDDLRRASGHERRPGRRRARGVSTVVGLVLVILALGLPRGLGALTPGAWVSVPVEALLGLALLIVLPARVRGVTAAVLGAGLGVVTVVSIVDLGFLMVLARPFDPVLDRELLAAAVGFLDGSIGVLGAVGCVLVAVVLTVALVTNLALGLVRVGSSLSEHRLGVSRVFVVVTVAWLTCALLGAQLVPGVPLTGVGPAAVVYDRAQQIGRSVQDQRAFAAETRVDAYGRTPDLLAGLEGKRVVVAFVESYGRDALADPELATGVGAVLDAGGDRLRRAGFGSRSAFLTSPTTGGASWLAHSTLLSGLWVDNQQRYRTLLASDRLTLTGVFRRSGWRTVGVMPGLTAAWPEGGFYGYDQVYGAGDLGYRGPAFSWATMPDQYTLSAFERLEPQTPGRPVMAVVPLVTSHAPWAPIPRLVDWRDVGDGSTFTSMAAPGDPPSIIGTRPRTQVRTDYRRSVEYALSTLVSYVETYGDDDLVLVFLGDHQPAPVVTGAEASWDVPITIVAHDRSVLDRTAGWGWQDGLQPDRDAPVWRMDAFRDRFLAAFGPEPGPIVPR